MAALDTGAANSMSDTYKGMSSDNIKGLVLGLSSSFFIGTSFIVKKKGLKKAGASGVRAGKWSNLFKFVFLALYYVQHNFDPFEIVEN